MLNCLPCAVVAGSLVRSPEGESAMQIPYPKPQNPLRCWSLPNPGRVFGSADSGLSGLKVLGFQRFSELARVFGFQSSGVEASSLMVVVQYLESLKAYCKVQSYVLPPGCRYVLKVSLHVVCALKLKISQGLRREPLSVRSRHFASRGIASPVA